MVEQCTSPERGLPPGKPRYVMGIGYPIDVLVCSALGADMYDSVYPTRTARFGVALLTDAPQGLLKLKNTSFGTDFRRDLSLPFLLQHPVLARFGGPPKC